MDKVKQQAGIIDLLNSHCPSEKQLDWSDLCLDIPVPDVKGRLALLSAGKCDTEYFKNTRYLLDYGSLPRLPREAFCHANSKLCHCQI